MFTAWVLTMMTCVFAGVGIKWAVDRVFPPPPRVIELPVQPRPQGGGPRLTALDDTMDVLWSGYEAGKHSRPAPEPPSVLDRLGVPSGVALPGGGWNSGPCVDEPPAERHAQPPSVLDRLGVPSGVALPGGGWNSGPCADGPPAERPNEADEIIEEIAAWSTSRPGQS